MPTISGTTRRTWISNLSGRIVRRDDDDVGNDERSRLGFRLSCAGSDGD